MRDMQRQKFGQGDIVMTDDGFRCKVLMPILDDDGWWYEIEAIDFDAPFTREVSQSRLEAAQ